MNLDKALYASGGPSKGATIGTPAAGGGCFCLARLSHPTFVD